MKKLFYLLPFIVACNNNSGYKSDEHIKDLNVELSNYKNKGLIVVFKEDLPYDSDLILLEENDDLVKKIENPEFKMGDTLMIDYPLKDSTDYSLRATEEFFDANSIMRPMNTRFWYTSNGDSLILDLPYDAVRKSKTIKE